MRPFLASIKQIGGEVALITPIPGVDPGFGQLPGGVDPGYGFPTFPHPGHGLPGGGHIGNALPIPPVRPSPPITLPPGVWPPQLPPGVDNSLPPPPPGHVAPPIYLPPDPDLGIEQPIVLPTLPPGVALLIALPYAQPKDAPANTKPAILVMSGKKPVLVYIMAAPTPK